ncbi:MAG: macro domain-containing protein [Prosthecobacter sp.]
MRLHFVDINQAVADALAAAFASHEEVEILRGDILALASHCVISPANSFGYMDGGMDAACYQFFGPSIQSTVQTAIQRRPEGMLPVGAALAVSTGHERIPYLIVAPTMEMPETVPASHAGRALRAALRLIDREPCLDGDVFCPGLTTLVGGVDPTDAAASMASAYESWLQNRTQDLPITIHP